MTGWPLCVQWEMPDFRRISVISSNLFGRTCAVEAVETTSVILNPPVSAAGLPKAGRGTRTQCPEVSSLHPQLTVLGLLLSVIQADGISGREGSGEC